MKVTAAQARLAKKHGTPEQFEVAVMNAIGEWISPAEAHSAIVKYRCEWAAAENTVNKGVWHE